MTIVVLDDSTGQPNDTQLNNVERSAKSVQIAGRRAEAQSTHEGRLADSFQVVRPKQ